MKYSVHLISNDYRVNQSTFDTILILGRSEICTNFTPFVNHQYSKHSWNVGHDFTGQWWFLLQDSASGKIKLIRDKHGYTSLFFTIIEERLYVSENINDLLRIKKFEINTERIACSMLLNITETEAGTYFNDIYALPAGYQMLLENKKLNISRYWYPEHSPKLVYKNNDQYIEEFGEIYRKSVESSVEKYSTIASTLSGGLDSSSVTCLAARCLDKSGRSIHSFTHVPAFTDLPFDIKGKFGNEEWHVSEILKQHKNINGEFVRSENISPIEGIKKLVDITGGLIHGAANSYWLYDIYNKVAEGGYELLLTGENGNATISYLGNRRLLNWRNGFYRQNFKLWIIDQIYWPAKHYLANRSDESFDIGFHFLNTGTIEDLQLKNFYLSAAVRKSKKQRNPVNNSKEIMLDSARKTRMPIGGQFANHFGFTMIDPTGTEELIEYSYSIPNEVYFGEKGMNKYLIRKLMDGILPEKVRWERRVGQQSSDIALRLKQTAQEVDLTLKAISENHLFNYLFNAHKLQEFWHQLKINGQKTNFYEINSFLKVVMAGIFIEKYY